MSAIKEHYHEEICQGQQEAGLVIEKPAEKIITEKSIRHQVKRNSVKRSQPLPKRNDKCPCGSGKKYKKCCQLEYVSKLREHIIKTRYEPSKQPKDGNNNKK
jgi:hypothetical protein